MCVRACLPKYSDYLGSGSWLECIRSGSWLECTLRGCCVCVGEWAVAQLWPAALSQLLSTAVLTILCVFA